MATATQPEQKFEIEKPKKIEMLRASTVSASPIGVDRKAGIIRGVVIAQKGPFKTGRGEFDDDSLTAIQTLVNSEPDGLKSNYGHQKDEGSAAELDAFIGRKKNAVIDGDKVRADLHFNPVAMLSVNGSPSPADKLMTRAETDPNSFGSSLALASEKKYRLDARGRRERDESGSVKPPIWIPKTLGSSDIVSNGDAVHDGFLSAADESFSKASTALDEILSGVDEETIEAWFKLYMTSRFGSQDDESGEAAEMTARKKAFDLLAAEKEGQLFGGMSFGDVTNALDTALQSKFGDGSSCCPSSCWITDVYDGYCVYNRDGKLFRQEYTVTDRAVTLAGDPALVQRVTSYVPASETGALNASQDDQGDFALRARWRHKQRKESV